ncbi:molybdopterin-guanine dinucleotide biosynthesis protein B [Paenibacillus sp. TAB 01]|uniref:molybdopterin-guanine dinucleotide biosynthesis protein B n=1 Tax=Paenibacillus sp. TAB 01 TaxID=3368988 RepID=UPI003750B532
MAAIVGLAGFSNSGKTTLVTKLVRYFTALGVRTAVIKHDGHGHYKEAAGADSTLFIEAGAQATVVVSPDAYRLYRKQTFEDLETVIAALPLAELDLVLIEGFKQGPHDKIALFRSPEQASLLDQLPEKPIAAVTPQALREYAVSRGIPSFDPDDISSIASMIQERYRLSI